MFAGLVERGCSVRSRLGLVRLSEKCYSRYVRREPVFVERPGGSARGWLKCGELREQERRRCNRTPDSRTPIIEREAQRGFRVLMPSTPFAYPQVISRRFAYFRVVRFGVSAGQVDFCAEFDSRQLHRKDAGQET